MHINHTINSASSAASRDALMRSIAVNAARKAAENRMDKEREAAYREQLAIAREIYAMHARGQRRVEEANIARYLNQQA